MKFSDIYISIIIVICFSAWSLGKCEKERNYLNSKIRNKSEIESLKTKTISQVDASTVDRSQLEEKNLSNYANKYFKSLFSFSSPINKCVKENCQYCCLSLNFCGSKEQCENTQKTTNIFKIIFMTIATILFIFLLYKIYITDPESEHTDSDRMQDSFLHLMITIFLQSKENSEKFKI